jgi:hypothetical protein
MVAYLELACAAALVASEMRGVWGVLGVPKDRTGASRSRIRCARYDLTWSACGRFWPKERCTPEDLVFCGLELEAAEVGADDAPH